MRLKKEAVLRFESNDDGLPKVVRDYRARYRTISQVLDKNAEILGRKGVRTIFRQVNDAPASNSSKK